MEVVDGILIYSKDYAKENKSYGKSGFTYPIKNDPDKTPHPRGYHRSEAIDCTWRLCQIWTRSPF
jgi:hypothetical protein